MLLAKHTDQQREKNMCGRKMAAITFLKEEEGRPYSSRQFSQTNNEQPEIPFLRDRSSKAYVSSV